MNLSLYLVTHRGSLSREAFFRIVREAVAGGVTIVQLREKEAPFHEMVALAQDLLAFLRPLGIPLIVNDRVDVAAASGADGVHLGQSDVKVSEARKMLGRSAIIGLSVETMQQALDAAHEEVDYLAASPVFSSKTKTDCAAPWGLDGLKRLCAVAKHPVIGIGGIDAANAGDVLACGAVGVAVISAIFGAPCPRSAAAEMRHAFS